MNGTLLFIRHFCCRTAATACVPSLRASTVRPHGGLPATDTLIRGDTTLPIRVLLTPGGRIPCARKYRLGDARGAVGRLREEDVERHVVGRTVEAELLVEVPEDL